MRYEDLTMEQFRKIVRRLGGADKALAFLRGDTVVVPAPLAYKQNAHGFYHLSVVGRGLTGKDEMLCQEKSGNSYTMHGCWLLQSSGIKGYDAAHRLPNGCAYKMSFYKGDGDKTYAEINDKASQLGYQKLKAEAVARMCETMSAYQMDLLGIRKMVGAHDPITVDGQKKLITCETHANQVLLSSQGLQYLDGSNVSPWMALAFHNPQL